MLDYRMISDLYDEGKTIREIAEIAAVSPAAVMRAFKKNGKELRTKSQAAKLAFQEGRMESPTKGKKRTKNERDRIANSRAAEWRKVDPETRESFRNAARERWNGASDLDKQERQRRAGEALSAAAKEGSKLEKFVYQNLTKDGYNVIMHKKGLIPGEKYELDLYLPDLKIVIEIDGPQHFLPLFGEDRLKRVIRYDEIKNGVLVSNGLCVIRVKFTLKALSDYAAKKIYGMIREQIEKVSKKFPSAKKRIIELETNFE